MTRLLLTYYGDDFTGSTDVMEALTLGGLRTALFLSPPSPEQITGRFAGLQALGVAGVSRSMTPAQMDLELQSKFRQLKQLGAPIFHYKICSTFDSSPQVGSIGHAADIGTAIFEPKFIPMVVGAPVLKRYVIFGNLFATVGPDTYRLDRHPTMSKHPITPMNESDLRLHLSQQTHQSIALLDILHLAGTTAELDERFKTLLQHRPHIILFDTLDQSHLTKIGRLIWEYRDDRPLFVIGSSGVEYALTAYWQQINLVSKPPPLQPPGPAAQLIVVSGSAAPTTAGQITWALENGFAGLRLDPTRLVHPDLAETEKASIVRQGLDNLGAGRSLILYSAQGPDDPAIEATKQQLHQLGLEPNSLGRRLGQQQGQILHTLLTQTGLRRVCVAGGDTSGYVALQLGIYALEMIIPIAPGAPLCRASSHHPAFDGLEISLKGGQNGQVNFFGLIKAGQAQKIS
jgi:uncharacterized protein YgbK (DUF1537 family)